MLIYNCKIYQRSYQFQMIGKNLKNLIYSRTILNSLRMNKIFSSQKSPKKIPEINQLKKDWNNLSDSYKKIDMAPQTFYYSLLSLMNLQNAKNVLQVACGTGRLLPIAVGLKNLSTKYLGVDISEGMIQNAKANLQQNLQNYDSKLTLDQWLQKHNLTLKATNAQEKVIEGNQKFDRIICNLVLMLTQNPQKMLQSLYDQAQEGCILGITVWGDKDKNKFLDIMRTSILESGFELPNVRSNFHMYKKAGVIAEKIGWKKMLNWQQNVIFPVVKFDDFSKYEQFFMAPIKNLPENQQEPVSKKLREKVQKLFETKQGLNFSCQLYLFQK